MSTQTLEVGLGITGILIIGALQLVIQMSIFSEVERLRVDLEAYKDSAGVVPVPERVANRAGKSNRPQERAIAADRENNELQTSAMGENLPELEGQEPDSQG